MSIATMIETIARLEPWRDNAFFAVWIHADLCPPPREAASPILAWFGGKTLALQWYPQFFLNGIAEGEWRPVISDPRAWPEGLPTEITWWRPKPKDAHV